MNTVTLNAFGYTADFLPQRGGSCIRLSRWGAQVLRTPKAEADYGKNPFLWGTPLLFLPNRISGGSFCFENRQYRFPVNEPATGCFLHGTLHETPFTLVHRDDAELLLRYQATNTQPYLTFPHAFTLELRWCLTPEGLQQEVTIRNDSCQNMPVALAFHTTFCLPFTPESDPEKTYLQLDTSREYGRNMANYLPDGSCAENHPDKDSLACGSFRPCEHTISRLFSMGEKHEMVLTDPAAGIRVRYHASDAYGYWMVYNGGSRDFLCVEPQTWLSNCPNAPFPREETGFRSLAPGDAAHYKTCLSIDRL